MRHSYDKFTAMLKQNEYVQDFLDLWAFVLKDTLSDNSIVPVVEHINNQNIFNINKEQLFKIIECGDQVEDLLIEFLRKHPDAEIECTYESTYNYCSSMNLKFITYNNGTIYVHAIHSETPYIDKCNSCNSTLNNVSLYEFKNKNHYICPACNAKVSIDINIDDYSIDVESGKYSFKDDELKFEDIY